MTLLELIRGGAARSPHAPAILAEDRLLLDYATLETSVRDIVTQLNAHGVGRGDRVAIVLPNGPEMAVAFFAVASAAACAPLNGDYTSAEYEFYLSDLHAKAMIVPVGVETAAVEVAERLGVGVIRLDVDPTRPAGLFTLHGDRGKQCQRPGNADTQDVALVLHTSGTTSRPKIVPLTHANLCRSAHNIARVLALSAADRCLNVMPLFHIHGLVGAVLSSIASGGSVVTTPGFQAPRFLAWLQAFRPTWYTAVPTMHQAILERAATREDLTSQTPLRLIRSSSAALPAPIMEDLERTFGVPVIESYGMTEAAHQMASNPLPPGVRKPRSVGIAAGPQIAVMDEQNRLVLAGEIGEVLIRGDNVTTGYENNPTANEQSFTDGWFHTGDQGYLDDDGYLFLTGRLKEIINRGGEKISPREIDEVLLVHPKVAQAVAFAVPDRQLGEEIAVAIVVKPGETVTSRELSECASRQLAHFKLPRKIVFVDQIPKGPTGKLQRIGLAKQLGLDAPDQTQRGSCGPYIAPSTDTERWLAATYKEILDGQQVGAGDEFFALGGDSHLAMGLLSRLRAQRRVELPIYMLFERPTLRELAATIDSITPSPLSLPLDEIAPGKDADECPLSYQQRAIWTQERLVYDGPSNIRAGTILMRGALDVPVFVRALEEIVRQHEILRATVVLRGVNPEITVHPVKALHVPLADLSAVDVVSRDEGVRAEAHKMAHEPFDVSASPLCRFRLVRLGEKNHLLLVAIHHMFFDGWSMGILINDLASIYKAFINYRKNPLLKLPFQYTDFARTQRRWIDEGGLDSQVAYWQRQLAEPLVRLDLPGDLASSTIPRWEGKTRTVWNSTETLEGLKTLGSAEGTTLFMTLYGAFSALLHSMTGKEDIMIGTLVAGRHHRGLESLIGLFANTLVLRTNLSNNPTIRELLGRVRKTILEVYANQDVPFEILMRRLKPKRIFGGNPYFDAVFQFRNMTVARVEAGSLSLREIHVDPGIAHYALLVDTFVENGRLGTRFEYSTGLFDESRIECWIKQWSTLLDTIWTSASQPLSKLLDKTTRTARSSDPKRRTRIFQMEPLG